MAVDYQTAFDVSPAGMAVVDDRLVALRVNPALAALTGAADGAPLGRLLERLGLDAAAGFLNGVASGDRPSYQADMEGLPADGGGNFYRVDFRPLPSPPTRFLLTITPAAPPHRAPATPTEDRLRKIIEFNADAILIIDQEGRIQFTNPAAVELFGLDRNELVGRDFGFPLAEKTAELSLFSSTKGIRQAEMRASSIQWEGRPAYLASLRDMTDRIAAEQALRESEEKFRLISEQSLMAIVIIQDRKIQYFNQAFRVLTGYGQEEIEAWPPGAEAELIHPDDREFVLDLTRRKLAGEGNVVARYAYRLQDSRGRTKWVDQYSKTVAFQGRPAILLTLLDITERVQAEEQRVLLEARLRQSQKMEAVGALAGGIAHDFNNILASIMGNAELILFDPDNPREVRQRLEQVLKSSNRARNLVRQILSFSRKDPHERLPVRLDQVLTEALNGLAPTFPPQVEMIRDIEAAGAVMGEADQLRRIVGALCANAVQAMGEAGGALRVHLSAATLNEEMFCNTGPLKPGDYLVLEVSDQGPGIAPEILDRVFEPYVSTKRGADGAGLGLAVVHGIVLRHEGQISVRNRPNGAAFKVYLPRIGEMGGQTPALPEADAAKSAEGGILVVDDQAPLARIARQMLSNLGYRVTAVDDSLAALQAFQKAPDRFNLIIADQAMPQMSGLELARRILEARPDLPVIVCTDYKDMDLVEKARALGVKDVLQKPFTMLELADSVHKTLGRTSAA